MEILYLCAALRLAESLEPVFGSRGRFLGPGGTGRLALDIFWLGSQGYDRDTMAVELGRRGWDLDIIARAAPRIDFAVQVDCIILGRGYDPRDPLPDDCPDE